MTLQTGDMRFARSAVMADTDNGGGPPSAQLLPDGSSNGMFPDLSEDAWTGGLAEVRHMHGVLRNTDTDPLLGASIILAEPPDDPNVSISMVRTNNTFARRPDIVKLLEASSTPGSEINGFLLEAHVEGARGLRIGQRPGVEPPAVNTGLVIVLNEGLVNEISQFVRLRRVTVSTEVFTEVVNGQPVDYNIQVAACELYSPLEHDFAGSAATRLYTRQAGKALLRKVVFNDAGTVFSASRLTEACEPDDMTIRVASVYTQLVPNTRTETPLLNQMPGGQRAVQLVDAYGTLEVTASSHTDRIAITEVNQGNAYVFKLQPPPAPNSVSFSYLALGEWQAIVDNGAGQLGGGPGTGTVLYSTGDAAPTFDALPDINSFVLASWADTAPYINVCAAGPVVLAATPPEFALDIAPGANTNGATITWPSGGSTKTATVNAAGVISGDATGRAVGSLGKVFIRPTAMPDPGANFGIEYAARPTVVESFSGVTVDAGGFGALALADEPIPGTACVRWTTARKVSKSSGADLSGTKSTEGSTQIALGSSSSWYQGTPTTVSVRTSLTNSTYTQTTESSSTDTQVVSHAITDDGAGGFGHASLGTINYAGKAVSVRMVSAGASVTSYRSDQEDATTFYSAGTVIRQGAS